MFFHILPDINDYLNIPAVVTSIPGVNIGIIYTVPHLFSLISNNFKTSTITSFQFYSFFYTGNLFALLVIGLLKLSYSAVILSSDIIFVLGYSLLFLNWLSLTSIVSFMFGCSTMMLTIYIVKRLSYCTLSDDDDEELLSYVCSEESEFITFNEVGSLSIDSLYHSIEQTPDSEYSNNVFVNTFGAFKFIGLSLGITLANFDIPLIYSLTIFIAMTVIHLIGSWCMPSNVNAKITSEINKGGNDDNNSVYLGGVTRLIVENLGSVVFNSEEEEELYGGPKDNSNDTNSAVIFKVENKLSPFTLLFSRKAFLSNLITFILFMIKQSFPILKESEIQYYKFTSFFMWITPFIFIYFYKIFKKKSTIIISLLFLILLYILRCCSFIPNIIYPVITNLIFLINGSFFYTLPYTMAIEIYPQKYLHHALMQGELFGMLFKFLNLIDIHNNNPVSPVSIRYIIQLFIGLIAIGVFYKEKKLSKHSLLT